ncbi:DMT family transporter [candidate division WWE3 bacterium]|uniref:DMT family transporter n=1 Tax=candidate division WWE3 bacterium TaxID=2053526 RepID=A0A7X9DK63_UNCKA|nr:DMT family transporter [candidate division WWE3 bacterium]
MSKSAKGIYLAFITALISGFSIFLNKYAVGIISPPLYFTAIKNAVVAVLILIVVLNGKKLSSLKTLSRRDLLLLISVGVIGGSIPFYLFFTGLSQVSSVNAAIIQKMMIVWVALLAGPVLKEKLTRIQFSAVAILFLSNFVIGGFKGFTFSTGELMIFASTLFWAVEYMLAKKVLKNVDPDVVVLFRMGIGSILLLGATFFTSSAKNVKLDSQSLFWFTLSVGLLFGYVISWYRALKFTKATTVVSILVASTLVTNVLSAIFVTKTITPEIAVQTLLIIAGSALFYTASKREKTSLAEY